MPQNGKERATYLQDDNGNNSSIRLVLVIAVVSVLGVWGIASMVSIMHNSGSKVILPDIPVSVTTLVSVLAGGKVAQKFGEKKPDSSAKTPLQNGDAQDG
jgi:hypothetical protein